MCCNPIRKAVRAAIHYYRRASQTLIHGKIIISSLLLTVLASTSVFDTITEQRFEISGRELQSHKHTVGEGFIPIEARSGHRLMSVLVTEDDSNRRHLNLHTMSFLRMRYIFK